MPELRWGQRQAMPAERLRGYSSMCSCSVDGRAHPNPNPLLCETQVDPFERHEAFFRGDDEADREYLLLNGTPHAPNPNPNPGAQRNAPRAWRLCALRRTHHRGRVECGASLLAVGPPADPDPDPTAMEKLRCVSGGRIAHAANSRSPPYSHVHVRRERLGFVHRSKAISSRPVPNPSVRFATFASL
jgi:hypothetical protein